MLQHIIQLRANENWAAEFGDTEVFESDLALVQRVKCYSDQSLMLKKHELKFCSDGRG